MATNYRSYVGPEERYDETGRQRFALLQEHGLQPHHRVLDVGCGSLRVGRHLIPYLEPGRYCGLDPGEEWVREGLQREVVAVHGAELVEEKRPSFAYNEGFDVSVFGQTFDYVVAFAVFIHCGRAQLELFLANARAVMAPEACLLLDLNIAARSSEQGRHRNYRAASHQKARHSRTDAEALFARAGYRWTVLDEQASARKDKTRALFELRMP